MERKVTIYRSFDEEAEATRAYYQSLTPAERGEIVLSLIQQFYGTVPRLDRSPGSLRIERHAQSGDRSLGESVVRQAPLYPGSRPPDPAKS